MKNYRILSASNVDTLAEYIERALNDGWVRQGDVFLTHSAQGVPLGGMVNQSIIKITSDRPSVVEGSSDARAETRAEVMGGPLQTDVYGEAPKKLPDFN